MIEKVINYTDLLAILLGIAFAGLLIFSLYFIGLFGTDSEIESDTDLDVDGDLDLDVEADLDLDVDTDIDLDVDADLDLDIDADVDFDVDADMDMEVDSDVEMHGDVHGEVHQDIHTEIETEIGTIGATGELGHSIETDGGGSLFAQIGAFCLAFGLFGFFTVLSIEPKKTNKTEITDLDIAIAILFVIGIVAYKISNKALKALTKGSLTPVMQVQVGNQVTVVSEMIDHSSQGRVVVETPDGSKIMMAISFDIHDMFHQGDRGYIVEPDVPLKIAKMSSLTKKWS